MCLILEIPDGADPLSREEAADVWKRNPHGACAIRTRNGAVLYRGLDEVDATAAIVDQTGIVVHWRQATSGARTIDQVHGWPVGSARLFHNGALASWARKERSDTQRIVAALVLAGVDIGSESSHALLRGIAAHTVFVSVPIAGGAPWWSRPPYEGWRGRRYSNGYAWDAWVHGKPVSTPDQIGFWLGWSDGDVVTPRSRRRQ